MSEEILEKAKKEANEIWEKELKKDITDHIQNCLMQTLKELDTELKKYDNQLKTHIQSLDREFREKFENHISQMKNLSNNNDKKE